MRTFRVPAPRGAILDRNGEPLVSNRPGTRVQIWPAALEGMTPERRAALLERLAKIVNVPVGEIRKELKAHRDDPLTPVTVREAVRDDKVRFLLEHQAQFPGIEINEVELRRYEKGNLGAQLFGYVSEISADQLAKLEQQGYAAGDRIGQVGIESAYDRYLRGVAGVGEVNVDAMGRVTSERQFSRFPEPGYSVQLTLDSGLQEAAENALKYGVALAQDNGEWAADGGAIVAMNPNDGEVLALASSPTFDPSVYVGRVRPQALKRLAAPEANYPTLNRAVTGLYPPGSTFKPVTALAAIQEGLLSPSEIIQCTGSIKAGEDQQVFRNWDPNKNEPMTLTTALANSCDTYFYDVALRAYERPDSPIQKWARRMGFGQETGIDVGPEGEGLVPTPAWRKRHFESAWDQQWRPGDSIQLGIGQGDMLATPLQMTRMYALIANGGSLVQPRIVQRIVQPATEGDAEVVIRSFPGTKPEDIGLDPTAVSTVQEGLYDATHASYGTSTSVFSHFPVPIAGKTGTAEKYVTIGKWSGLRDQSWWCGWGPYADPELVVCAVIENGGHGGEAAAPAALKVFEKFFGVEPGSYTSGAVESD